MTYHYTTTGTCSRAIDIDIDSNGIITDVNFTGGCAGNTLGVRALAIGRPATEVIATLKGITCGSKPTSCPDQLATALTQALAQ
ncbi:MAG: TIGR03905 family TSCPD domain-containing protein [Muribaculaceae bacterium]|nr:TIGR03905 family TSCPD domain-containing protein [Muribaculaceae bacterium]